MQATPGRPSLRSDAFLIEQILLAGDVMQQAVCDNGAPNCLAFRVPLSPSITYSFLITNPNGDMTCHADYTFLSYVQGAPGMHVP